MRISLLTPIEQYIVDYVTKLRMEHNLNQEDIGFVIGVGQSFVANIENPKKRAKYNVNHINKLADHFGLSPKDFMPQNALKE